MIRKFIKKLMSIGDIPPKVPSNYVNIKDMKVIGKRVSFLKTGEVADESCFIVPTILQEYNLIKVRRKTITEMTMPCFKVDEHGDYEVLSPFLKEYNPETDFFASGLSGNLHKEYRSPSCQCIRFRKVK